MGIDLFASDVQDFLGIVNRDSGEHKNFMREKDSEGGVCKDDEFASVEGFELSTVHVPGSLFAGLMETLLLPLPHEKGGGEGFHGHQDINLDPYARLALLRRMFQVSILFRIAERKCCFRGFRS